MAVAVAVAVAVTNLHRYLPVAIAATCTSRSASRSPPVPSDLPRSPKAERAGMSHSASRLSASSAPLLAAHHASREEHVDHQPDLEPKCRKGGEER